MLEAVRIACAGGCSALGSVSCPLEGPAYGGFDCAPPGARGCQSSSAMLPGAQANRACSCVSRVSDRLHCTRANTNWPTVRVPACLHSGFPTRKPFMHFAQRYALLLPEAPTNGRAGPSRPGSAASAVSERSNGTAPGLPLTASGFIDWFALNENQVGQGAHLRQWNHCLLFAAPLLQGVGRGCLPDLACPTCMLYIPLHIHPPHPCFPQSQWPNVAVPGMPASVEAPSAGTYLMHALQARCSLPTQQHAWLLVQQRCCGCPHADR